MSLIHIEHVPETVKVNLPLNVILLNPGKIGEVPLAERKVLYLLHGLSEDASAWQRFTSVEALAIAYGYGAFKAALLYPERCAAAASFSGVLSLAIHQAMPEDCVKMSLPYHSGIWESYPEVRMTQQSGCSMQPGICLFYHVCLSQSPGRRTSIR